MKKAIVAGHVCLDVTPSFPENREKSLGQIFAPGKLTKVDAANIHTGGCVANTGLAMKFLGAPVTLMGKIGADSFGSLVLSVLSAHGAEGGMITDEAVSTSYSIVLAVPGVDRMFLHNPGANDTFRAEDVPQDALDEACLFHFGYPPLMKSMYENGGEGLGTLLAKAQKAGCAVSLDMAGVDPDSEAGKADWQAILTRVLPLTDFFVPSIEELLYMLDRNRWEALTAAGEDVTAGEEVQSLAAALADQCLSMGAKVVLIKCGVAGMYLKTTDEEALRRMAPALGLDAAKWANQSIFEESYVPDRVLSGTGCGDTSIAAFLTSILEGCGPEETMHLSAATGACCVTAYDALSGLLPLDELRKKIADGWKKLDGNE